jgi:hypothetical protein
MTSSTGKIDKWGKDLGARIQRWLQTETTFNFLRGTFGRVLLAITTILVLYVYGWIALERGGRNVWLYPLALALITLIQKISVRYAFDDDSQIDEFQHKRRNRAYRRAYKRVGAILLTIGMLCTWQYFTEGLFQALGLIKFELTISAMEFHMGYQSALVLGSFLVGLFVLQKYLSWGLKGEPKN